MSLLTNVWFKRSHNMDCTIKWYKAQTGLYEAYLVQSLCCESLCYAMVGVDRRAPPPDPYVASQVTNMWYNPLRRTSDGTKVSKSVKGCAIARASLILKQAISRGSLKKRASEAALQKHTTAVRTLQHKMYQPVLQKRPAGGAGIKTFPASLMKGSKRGRPPMIAKVQHLVRTKGKLSVSSRVQKLVRRDRSPIGEQRPLVTCPLFPTSSMPRLLSCYVLPPSILPRTPPCTAFPSPSLLAQFPDCASGCECL